MITGECFGLGFNKEIGTSFQHRIELEHGSLSLKDYSNYFERQVDQVKKAESPGTSAKSASTGKDKHGAVFTDEKKAMFNIKVDGKSEPITSYNQFKSNKDAWVVKKLKANTSKDVKKKADDKDVQKQAGVAKIVQIYRNHSKLKEVLDKDFKYDFEKLEWNHCKCDDACQAGCNPHQVKVKFRGKKFDKDNNESKAEIEFTVKDDESAFEENLVFHPMKNEKGYENKELKAEVKKYKKTTKLSLVYMFTIGNGLGRLLFGLFSDYLASFKILALQKSFYILFCSLMYIVLFAVYMLLGNVHEVANSVLALTFFIAFAYGGIYTMATSYMKDIVNKKQYGLLFGFSLLVLAAAQYVVVKLSPAGCKANTEDTPNGIFLQQYGHFGVFLDKSGKKNINVFVDDNYTGEKKFGAYESHEYISKNSLATYCLYGIIGNVIAAVAGIYIWVMQMKEKKEEEAKAAALDDDFSDDDTSDEDEGADLDARK